MKKLLVLLGIISLLAVGCATKESYDKPDPAPKNSQFETQTSAPDATGSPSNKGKADQATSDN